MRRKHFFGKKGISIEINTTPVDSFDFATGNNIRGIYISPDGLNFFLAHYGASDNVKRYTMSSPNDVNSLILAEATANLEGTGVYGVCLDDAGNYLYYGRLSNKALNRRTTSTPFSLASIGAEGVWVAYTSPNYPNNHIISHDGNYYFITGFYGTFVVKKFTLAVPYDITSVSSVVDYSLDTSFIKFYNDGYNCIVGRQSNPIRILELMAPYDISTFETIASSSNNIPSIGTQYPNIFLPDSLDCLIMGSGGPTDNIFYKYELELSI